MSVCIYVRVIVCISICLSLRISICLYICLPLCIAVCMCACLHRRRLWEVARARASKNRDTPMHLSAFTTFLPRNLGLPHQYFWQVYASACLTVEVCVFRYFCLSVWIVHTCLYAGLFCKITFPGTPNSRWPFLDIYPKTLLFSTRIFSYDLSLNIISKMFFFQPNYGPFLVIYHKNNLSPANFSNFCTFWMFLSKRFRYTMINFHINTMLTYKVNFRHFHFPVRRTGAYRHKKTLPLCMSEFTLVRLAIQRLHHRLIRSRDGQRNN